MTQSPEPVCKAILLCEKTIVEHETGSVSLIGIIEGFAVDEVAEDGRVKTRAAEAFCQFTEACGQYSLSVEIHDLENAAIVAGAAGAMIEIPDRLMRANVIFPIPPLPLPHTGTYDFVIFANGLEIDRQQFSVDMRGE
jgi:hypothetical protein